MSKSSVKKVQKTSNRPQRENIKGLPEHAQFQRKGKTWYVYFPYCFSANGNEKSWLLSGITALKIQQVFEIP